MNFVETVTSRLILRLLYQKPVSLTGFLVYMKYHTKLTFQKYWQHARKYKLVLFLSLIGLVGGPAVGAITPLYFKKFFDVLSTVSVANGGTGMLISILFSILGLELLGWVFWRIGIFFIIKFQSSVMVDVANSCFEYLHKHSFSFFNNNFVGSLVKRVNRFVRAFEGISDKLFFNLMQLLVNISIIFVVLLLNRRILGIMVLSWVIVFLIINWFFTKYKMKYDIMRADAETQITGVLADTITNHSNVKLFNGYCREILLFDKKNQNLKKLQVKTWNLEWLFEALQGLLMIGLEIGAFYYAILLWQKGLFSVGDFVLLQSYFIIIFMRVWDFGRVVRNIYRDLADAEEMAEIFDTPHGITDVLHAKPLVVTKGKIEFKNVSFFYHQTRRIIDKLNLTIKAKQKIAFVGPSGAGKSTVIKLLFRQHDISSGSIEIDGQRISRVTQESLWHNVSLVPQDPILFHRTLMENIRYGKPDASDEEVTKAAKLAHCHEFIFEFPDQYETFVGERGIKLSGGERQRVAIARAILQNAPILVLDEATSSLDSESERLIQDALDVLMKNKTVIVIAHRLSTIMRMDRIVVIDDGGIVEDGTHSQLMRKKQGLYARLWKVQAGGFIE